MSHLKLLYRSILYPKIRQLIISIWVDIFANINIKILYSCTDEPPSTRLFIAEPTAEIQQDKGKNLSLPLRRLNGSNYQCCHINGWHTETTRSTHTHTQRFLVSHQIWARAAVPSLCSWRWPASHGAPGVSAPVAVRQSSLPFSSCLTKYIYIKQLCKKHEGLRNCPASNYSPYIYNPKMDAQFGIC